MATATAAAQFIELVVDLPVASVFLEIPDEALIRDLEDIRRTILTVRNLRDDRAEVARRIDTWRDEVDEVREAVMIDLPTDAFDAIATVRRNLVEALDNKRVAEAATAELPELDRKLHLARAEVATVEDEVEKLNIRLGGHDPTGDPERGLERLIRSRDSRGEAQRIRTDLDREDPGWIERVEEGERLIAAGERIELSDEERVERRRRAVEVRKTERDLVEERGQLGNTRDELMKEPGPAHVAGEIQAAEEELALFCASMTGWQ